MFLTFLTTMLPSSSVYFSSVRLCSGMSGRLSACKNTKYLLSVHTFIHIRLMINRTLLGKGNVATNICHLTLINNNQQQHVFILKLHVHSLFQIILKMMSRVAEHLCHYPTKCGYFSQCTLIFQCKIIITSSNSRKKMMFMTK